LSGETLLDLEKPADGADTAVILHLYYPDLWDEIAVSRRAGDDFRLLVTIPWEVDIRDAVVLDRVPSARIVRCENRGRDIAPFLAMLRTVYPLGFKYICKIHTKRSRHREDGVKWRQTFWRNCSARGRSSLR
jgi:lipopolysaccharide biosynthesis protein